MDDIVKVDVIRATGLAQLDAATQALSKATSIQEIKKVRDVAEAIRKLAKTAGAGLDIQNEGAMLKIRAERKGGEKLKVMELSKGGQPKRTGFTVKPVLLTLEDLEIDKNQSRRWQAEADIPEKVQEEYFEQAREKGAEITTAGFMREGQKNKPKPEAPPLPKDQYNVIYADPPWKYSNSGLLGSAKQHYPTMSIDELCQLAVPEISNTNAVLFMWVTNPLLFECASVVFEWGFQYKTNICWSKKGRGTYGKLGFYVSGKHELLLICTKGSFLPAIKPDSVLELPKSKHSRKPDEVYSIIEKMYPDGKYVELFARQKRQGWSSWGNEV